MTTSVPSITTHAAPARHEPHVPALRTTLTLHNPGAEAAHVPLTTGVPFPRGQLFDPHHLTLRDHAGYTIELQTEPLARWSDRSIQWLLLDFIAPKIPAGTSAWTLQLHPIHAQHGPTAPEESRFPLRAHAGEDGLFIESHDPASRLRLRFPLLADTGETVEPRLVRSHLEHGPIHATLHLDGQYPASVGLLIHVRLHLFAGSKLVRADVRLRNPNRARHKGGLWDLGDPNSILFHSFHVDIEPQSAAEPRSFAFTTTPGQPPQCSNEPVLILQESSGEPRRSPTLAFNAESGSIALALPEFWQQFPKSLEANTSLRAGLFPDLGGHLYELQPGEQKTHTVWFQVEPGNAANPGALDWVHQPIRVALPPDHHAAAKCPSIAMPAADDSNPRLATFLAESLAGPRSIASRREVIDEYGWRNYGDLHADHEQEYYPGAEPVVSHYNNQFDLIYGGITQLARTGDPAWFDLFEPLARHVIDIDVYHTDRDRAAYNGGLFWHTDHYQTAGTATHRTYSRHNQKPGQLYGGGPSCEHNYTTGLLHYYYLSGNPDAREAVLSLASWVLNMDDGRNSVLGILDPGPTGLATATADENYHGPGRGAGNSINALTDAWLLTREHRYLDAAEALIRRVVHPNDDIPALNLLHAESRWSYTVCLVAIARWLDVKAEANQCDAAYAYAQHTLLHYARWMARHERPYFDHPEQLEYPTATWAAQELRKANVLRLAARHADEFDRDLFLHKGNELAERAWSDLNRFENRCVARCLSILMTEGARESWLRDGHPQSAPRMNAPSQWPAKSSFLPQKARIRRNIRHPGETLKMALSVINPSHWLRTLRLLCRQL